MGVDNGVAAGGFCSTGMVGGTEVESSNTGSTIPLKDETFCAPDWRRAVETWAAVDDGAGWVESSRLPAKLRAAEV